MAFVRTVKIGDYLYRCHQCVEIDHHLDKGTFVRIRSFEYGPESSSGLAYIDQVLSFDLTLDMSFSQGEELAKADSHFAEYTDSREELITEIAEMLTDEQAADVPFAYPAWTVGTTYTVGFRVNYNNIVYKCIQAHVSQEDWTPDQAVSLWVRARPEDIIPDWEQPTAENPYMTGDKVRYNGHVYVSLIDNNIWSPDDYPAGWQILLQEEG